MPRFPSSTMTEIQYLCDKTVLGRCCIALSPKGICFLEFGPSNRQLIDCLKRTFPKVAVSAADRKRTAMLRQVLRALPGPASVSRYKVDLAGTPFQQQVWRSLRTIPAGRTISYSDLAEKIGKPTATRAVARACASNRIGILVPCHRVVAKSGKLSGYRWGTKLKQRILSAEGV